MKYRNLIQFNLFSDESYQPAEDDYTDNAIDRLLQSAQK